jgi:signal transduction histidine kinase
VRSIRTRLLLGTFLWTIGLLAIWALVLTLSPPLRSSIIVVHQHAHMLGILAVGSMVTGVIIFRRVLAIFSAMRASLGDVRSGRSPRLDGAYPVELEPLVDDLNALLAHNKTVVARAIAKAGDLAHGLKTPLAVLSNESQRLSEHDELARTIAQQVALMQRHVEYHLAQARAAASGASLSGRSLVAESAEGLVRTLRRLHADRSIAIGIEIPATLAFRGQREDLDEMLGNLLDNACKWARSRVQVRAEADGPSLTIIVDDDGPGIPEEMRDRVLRRGVRADEAAPGSGLGLAIVRDLVDLYSGSIVLDDAAGGGLRARLRLPKSA